MSFNRHLLIDGANILHAWPELNALLRKDRDAARGQLIQRVAAIHDVEQTRVTIVFDGRGEKLTIEHPSDQPTFSVIFTPASVTADTVIEQMVGRSTDATSCIVATDDRAEPETISATGANAVAAAELIAWIGRVDLRQSAALKALRRSNDKDWESR